MTELPVKAGSGVVLYEVWNVSGRDPQDFMVNEPTEKATHVLRLSYYADVTVNRYVFFGVLLVNSTHILYTTQSTALSMFDKPLSCGFGDRLISILLSVLSLVLISYISQEIQIKYI